MRRANGRVAVVVRRSIDVDMRMEGMPDPVVPMTDPVMARVVADMSAVMHASMSDAVTDAMPDSVTNAMPDFVADAVSDSVADAVPKAVTSVTKAVTNAVATAVSETMHSAVMAMLGLHAAGFSNHQHDGRNKRKRTSVC